MELRYTVGIEQYKWMDTRELRETFLAEELFTEGELPLIYWEADRTVVGSAVPLEEPLILGTATELACDYFCQRRELGVMNLGAPGKVTVDGQVYALDSKDCLYVGRGSQEIRFESDQPEQPARYFLVSYPAHTAYPTTLIKQAEANCVQLGAVETANRRVIRQYIHEKGAKSCQLVMGFTQLEPGSVWNTMPAHTHNRRSEVYCYFNVPEESTVFHFMGPGDETRHLLIQNEQAVFSPIWSIHSGCGTSAYSFLWAMGGENQRFDDMDAIAINQLR